MTLYGFCQKLKESGIKFKFIDGKVRDTNGSCPICAICPEDFPNIAFMQAGNKLGLDMQTTNLIAASADSPNEPFRKQLLEACGL